MPELIARIDQGLDAGIFPDVTGRKPPIWIDGRNVAFGDQAVQPTAGQQLLFPKPSPNPVLDMVAYTPVGVPTLLYGGPTNLWRWTEADGVDSVGSGYDADEWVLETWGDWALATNLTDGPQIYKGTSFAALTGLGTVFETARILVRRSPFMFALNTSGGSNSGRYNIHCCDLDDVEDWVPTSTNWADFRTIRDLSSEFRCAKRSGENILAYTSDEVVLIYNIGAAGIVFESKPVIQGIGAVGPHAVCAVDRLHYGFGPKGIWRTDGQSKQYIDQGSVHDFIYDDLNVDALATVVAWHDPIQTAVVFFYPATGSNIPNRGMMFNYVSEVPKPAPLDYGRTAAAQSAAGFNFGLLGGSDGSIYFQDLSGDPSLPRGAATLELPSAASVVFPFGSLGFGQHSFDGSVSVLD